MAVVQVKDLDNDVISENDFFLFQKENGDYRQCTKKQLFENINAQYNEINSRLDIVDSTIATINRTFVHAFTGIVGEDSSQTWAWEQLGFTGVPSGYDLCILKIIAKETYIEDTIDYIEVIIFNDGDKKILVAPTNEKISVTNTGLTIENPSENNMRSYDFYLKVEV